MKSNKLDYPEKLKKKYISSADGAQIYYDTYYTSKTEPVLILIHGASGDASGWHLIRNVLYPAGYSTLAIDIRGHGFSSRSDTSEFYQVDKIIQDIKDIILKEKIKSFVLVGHCYGANIALKMASQHPKGLLRAVTINTSYKSSITDFYTHLGMVRQTLVWLIEKLPDIGKPGQTDFGKYIGTGDLHMGRIFATIWKNTVRSYLLTFDTVLSFDTEKDLPKITCPVDIIGGAKDTFFHPKTIYTLYDKMHNAQIHILPKGDHITVLNIPSEVAHQIISFMKAA